MAHFIAAYKDLYLYHRRNTGRMYVSRSMWGPDIGQARVFTTKPAATNSAKGALDSRDHKDLRIEPVAITVVKEDKSCT